MGEIFAFLAASWWATLIALILGGIWLIGWLMAEKKLTAGIGSVIVVLMAFVLCAGLSAYSTIERGNVGLVTRFGALTGEVFQPGLNWKTPFIESVEVFDTTQQAYETSEYPETSLAGWPDYTVTSQTSDGQTVKLSYTLIFRIPDGNTAVGIRQNIGPMDEIVENCVKANSRSISRNASRVYSAGQLYSGDVIEYQTDVFDQIRSQFDATCGGLILVDFKVRGIGFEEKYSDAIEAKQIEAERIIKEQNAARASVFEAQKIAELAKGDAQASIERATGDAESVRIRADADAYSVQVDADAQAYAIQELGKSLDKYESVLSLRFIENLNDKTLWLPSDAIQYYLPLSPPE